MSATLLTCGLLLFATTAAQGRYADPPSLVNATSEETKQLCEGDGYKSYSGSCYKPHKEKATWDEANAVCISEGGYLVEINDSDELQVVMKIRPNTSVWTLVGLRKGPDGEWRTTKGHPIDSVYNVWAADRNDECNCGFLRLRGTLDDLKCDVDAEPFLCEK